MSETMADYEDQINASFRSFREGDTVTGEVVSVEEEEVLLDLRSFSQGVLPVNIVMIRISMRWMRFAPEKC